MKNTGPSEARLACAFLAGCLLFGYPLMALFNVPGRIFGIPVLYAYLFAAWVLLILVVAQLMESRE